VVLWGLSTLFHLLSAAKTPRWSPYDRKEMGREWKGKENSFSMNEVDYKWMRDG